MKELLLDNKKNGMAVMTILILLYLAAIGGQRPGRLFS